MRPLLVLIPACHRNPHRRGPIRCMHVPPDVANTLDSIRTWMVPTSPMSFLEAKWVGAYPTDVSHVDDPRAAARNGRGHARPIRHVAHAAQPCACSHTQRAVAQRCIAAMNPALPRICNSVLAASLVSSSTPPRCIATRRAMTPRWLPTVMAFLWFL